MSFASDIRQFKNPAALAAYLQPLAIPDWPGEGNPRSTTVHNTYRPTEAQWLGRASMLGMQRDYIAKGWTAGPHFYLALGSPNPANDGIWQMTPPTQPGVHGVVCNATHFGVELVGDFQRNAPSLRQQALLIDTLVVLHHWAKLGPNFNMHRDCVERTCPGDAFYALKPRLLVQFAALMGQAGPYRVRHTQAIFEAPRPDGAVALADQAEVHAGDTVIIDEVAHGGWAHLQNGIGFVPVGVLEKL